MANRYRWRNYLELCIRGSVARRYLHLDVGLIHLRDVLVLLAVGWRARRSHGSLLLLAFGQLKCATVWASAPLLVGDIIGMPMTFRCCGLLSGGASCTHRLLSSHRKAFFMSP
jgi:hypothetical protein